MRSAREHGRYDAHQDQQLAEPDGGVVEVLRFRSLFRFTQSAEEGNHPQPEGSHGKVRPDPGEGGAIQSQRRAILRQRSAAARQINAQIGIRRIAHMSAALLHSFQQTSKSRLSISFGCVVD